MKRFLLFLCSLLSASIFNCQHKISSENVKKLAPKEFQSLLSADVQLIDVRTSKEFTTDHLPNAKNINFFSDDFNNKINELDKEKPVFIYCRSGKRSGKSIADFKKMGFKTIYELQGGFLNWKSENLDVEK
jgi:rhodanese-related sulfurtransferase